MNTALKAPPPPKTNGRTETPSMTNFSVEKGVIGGAQRVLVYGPGGIGKSTLARLSANPVFLDIENGTRFLDVSRISGIDDFGSLRACLQSNALDQFKTIVIDSVTMAEQMAVAHTLKTVKHEKGHSVNSVEGYGFGKGYQHVYDTFLLLLQDCDRHIRADRNVILIAHDCVADVPNPVGEDYIRYEPHLQSPKSGKGSIRNRVIQWADYVLFVGYDVISEDGKGKGGGTRTIFTTERPDHVAKSRTNIDTLPFERPDDDTIWKNIGGVA
jgi:hypothetical protein